MSFTSTGDDEKYFGTTFSSKNIGACYVKVDTDLGANASSYVNGIYLQKYTGTTWVTLLRLKQSITQTTSFIGVISNIGTCQGLRVLFDTESYATDTIDLSVTDFLYAQSFTYTPKYLLTELGGTPLEDLSDKTAISEDHTITWKALVRTAILTAENAVRTLQVNNIFTNGPNIVVDETTDANGTQGTINTGSSTAIYDTTYKHYHLDSSIGTQQNLDSTEYSTTNTSSTLVATYSSINSTIFEHRNQIKNDGGDTTTCSVKFIYSDATAIFVNNTQSGTIYTSKTYTNPHKQKEVSSIEVYIETTSGGTAFVDENEYYSLIFDSSNTVIADTNTTSLDGNELGFAISVPDSDIPTGTSIGVIISDGTNSLTETIIDSQSKGVVIGNPNTLSSGTLKATFKLNTTDTSKTPILSEYGLSILR